MTKDITPTQIQEYFETGCCPVCGAYDMEIQSEMFDYENRPFPLMTKTIKCYSCGLVLEESWKLYDINYDKGEM
jgi:hypothetical protein